MTAWSAHQFFVLSEFVTAGGPALAAIVGIAVLVGTLAVERATYYAFTYRDELLACRACWAARCSRASWRSVRLRRSLLGRLRLELRRFLPMVACLVKVCPLLGLLGTVLGMMECFDGLAGLGTTDARVLAAGISQATISTMGGLVVAATGLLVHARLVAVADRLEHEAASAFRERNEEV